MMRIQGTTESDETGVSVGWDFGDDWTWKEKPHEAEECAEYVACRLRESGYTHVTVEMGRHFDQRVHSIGDGSDKKRR